MPGAETFTTLHLDLEHLSTVDRVADELRRAVFDGELESGTPLREVALADSLGVSRSTVREALTVLVGEGLAIREPHRGVAVATSDPDSVHDVCRARLVLELAGVRSWPDATEELRDEVRDALAAYAEAANTGASYQVLNERHLAFHLSLVALAGSPGWRRWPPACTPSSGSRSRRSTGRARTPPTRPGPTRCCSGCSTAATSPPRSRSSSGTSPAPRSRSWNGCPSGADEHPAPRTLLLLGACGS